MNEIYENNYKMKEEMFEVDLLNFEIDSEIKLIGDERITSLWNDMLAKKNEISLLLENLYKIKGDQEKCENFINDLPCGLLNRDHQLSSLFLNSYSTLMNSLLIFYREQEDKLSYSRWLSKIKKSRKRF